MKKINGQTRIHSISEPTLGGITGRKKKQAPLGSAMVEVMVPLKCMALIVGQGMKP